MDVRARGGRRVNVPVSCLAPYIFENVDVVASEVAARQRQEELHEGAMRRAGGMSATGTTVAASSAFLLKTPLAPV